MRARDLSFETWCQNHPDAHETKWCRELYPWHVFAQLEYSEDLIGIAQELLFDGVKYTGTLTRTFLGPNERLNHLVRLTTRPLTSSAEWESRRWDDLFHLVTSADNHFITLYTEKRDPSKVLVSTFMGADFRTIESVKSIPVSQLLFRSLVSYAAEEFFGQLGHFVSFEYVSDGVRTLPRHPQYQPTEAAFAPLRSKDRDIWVLCAFREEKAHRLAFYHAAQCRRLIVVYCIPTFSPHHRCEYPDVQVVSLLSFVRSANSRFVDHARVLMNHLSAEPISENRIGVAELERRIKSYCGQPMPILASQIREAKAALELEATQIGEVAYFFACANLVNAALTHRYGGASETRRLAKNVYTFKKRVWETMLRLKDMQIAGLGMYVSSDGPAYVTVESIQFSFQGVPPALREGFRTWEGNAYQDWSGLRLQPIAPLVLTWARAKMMNGDSRGSDRLL